MMRDLPGALALALVVGACAGAPVNPGTASVTPFGSSPAKRAEYLSMYQAGYEAMLKGNHSTYCVRGEASRARQLGWLHGQDAAYLLWHRKLEAAIQARDRAQLLALFEGRGKEAHEAVDSILAAPASR